MNSVLCLFFGLTLSLSHGEALAAGPGGFSLSEINGLNAGTRLKSPPFIPWHGSDSLTKMRSSGFNVMRLPLQWAAIEPTPGVYDEKYLDGLETWIAFAGEHGVTLILDMHQDGFSALVGGNGAPDWATLPTASGSIIPLEGMPWFFRYLDRKVMTSFDSFWANRVIAHSGLGLQDHYARMFAHVAARFSKYDHILGYDLMNEPFYGSDFEAIALRLARKNWWFLAKHSLLNLFKGVDMMEGLVDSLRDPDDLDHFLGAADPLVAKFERNKLMPFYDRVSQAIRAVDSEGYLFIEATPLKIQGGRSFLRKPVNAKGVPFERVVFAPHYYDPTTLDGWKPFDGNTLRLRRSIERTAAEGRAMGVPVVYGEWGNFAEGLKGADHSIQAHRELFSEFGTGSLYWAFEPQFPSSAYWEQLAGSSHP